MVKGNVENGRKEEGRVTPAGWEYLRGNGERERGEEKRKKMWRQEVLYSGLAAGGEEDDDCMAGDDKS